MAHRLHCQPLPFQAEVLIVTDELLVELSVRRQGPRPWIPFWWIRQGCAGCRRRSTLSSAHGPRRHGPSSPHCVGREVWAGSSACPRYLGTCPWPRRHRNPFSFPWGNWRPSVRQAVASLFFSLVSTASRLLPFNRLSRAFHSPGVQESLQLNCAIVRLRVIRTMIGPCRSCPARSFSGRAAPWIFPLS